MAVLCPRSRHLFLRTMSVLTLTLPIGRWESKKVVRSLKDHWKHFGPSCSLPNNKLDTGSLHMLQVTVKEEEVGIRRSRRTSVKILEDNLPWTVAVPLLF